MTLHVLDTDILSLYQQGQPAVRRSVLACPPDDLAITVISVEEPLSGWYAVLRRARQRHDLAQVYQRLTDSVSFLSRLQILSFTEPAIARYDQLQALKLNVGKMDLRIAAIVLENQAT